MNTIYNTSFVYKLKTNGQFKRYVNTGGLSEYAFVPSNQTDHDAFSSKNIFHLIKQFAHINRPMLK